MKSHTGLDKIYHFFTKVGCQGALDSPTEDFPPGKPKHTDTCLLKCIFYLQVKILKEYFDLMVAAMQILI